MENNFNSSFIPLSYNYLNQISFKGNANSISKEDKMPIEIEEEKLTDLLIKPALEGKSLPSGILLYSENNIKSSELFEKVAKKGDLRVLEFDSTQEDFAKDLLKTLRNSRQNYLDNKQKTVILIKNSDLLLSDKKSNLANVSITKCWLKNCSKIPTYSKSNYYAATLVFETSNPQAVSNEILKNKNIKGFINVQMDDLKEIKKLVTSFVNEKGYEKELRQIDDKKIEKISWQLAPNTNDGAYSDIRIASILEKAIDGWSIQNELEFDEIVKNKVETAKRNIPPRVIANALEARKWLIENKWIDAPHYRNIDDFSLDKISSNCQEKQQKLTPFKNELSQILAENETFIQNAKTYNNDELAKTTIDGKPLVDFWLEISEENISNKGNQRLKNMWFDEILSNKAESEHLISKTIKILKERNEAISLVKRAFTDIIENDETLSARQKAILAQQQESQTFFEVVKPMSKSNKMVQTEDNTLTILNTLAKEEKQVTANAQENIFEPAKNSMILSSDNSDDIAIVNYIFELLSQYALNGTNKEKDDLKEVIQSFGFAKDIGDVERLNFNWQKMVQMAQKYFETEKLNELTNNNIILLNSIADKKRNIQDKTILKLLDDNSFTIEQKEFIARYANDNNFKSMIKNQNLDMSSTVEDLVYFEANNKNLIEQADLSLNEREFNKMMSDKFKEINRKAKDINIQGNKIASKLDSINETIGNQNTIISTFANNFEQYSNASLSIQLAQFNELAKISQNTQEIKQYTQTLTRAKLIELEKDKYYADIIPELTKLLPENEQIDIQEFLSKVDELVKYEKNDIKKKKIIKAATIVAGVAAAGVATYFFGPTVIAHLFSKVANPTVAGSCLGQVAAGAQIAKKTGNSFISFGNGVGWPSEWYSIESQLLSFSTRDEHRAVDAVKSAKGSGGISIEEIKSIISRYGFRLVNGIVVRK